MHPPIIIDDEDADTEDDALLIVDADTNNSNNNTRKRRNTNELRINIHVVNNNNNNDNNNKNKKRKTEDGNGIGNGNGNEDDYEDDEDDTEFNRLFVEHLSLEDIDLNSPEPPKSPTVPNWNSTDLLHNKNPHTHTNANINNAQRTDTQSLYQQNQQNIILFTSMVLQTPDRYPIARTTCVELLVKGYLRIHHLHVFLRLPLEIIPFLIAYLDPLLRWCLKSQYPSILTNTRDTHRSSHSFRRLSLGSNSSAGGYSSGGSTSGTSTPPFSLTPKSNNSGSNNNNNSGHNNPDIDNLCGLSAMQRAHSLTLTNNRSFSSRGSSPRQQLMHQLQQNIGELINDGSSVQSNNNSNHSSNAGNNDGHSSSRYLKRAFSHSNLVYGHKHVQRQQSMISHAFMKAHLNGLLSHQQVIDMNSYINDMNISSEHFQLFLEKKDWKHLSISQKYIVHDILLHHPQTTDIMHHNDSNTRAVNDLPAHLIDLKIIHQPSLAMINAEDILDDHANDNDYHSDSSSPSSSSDESDDDDDDDGEEDDGEEDGNNADHANINNNNRLRETVVAAQSNGNVRTKGLCSNSHASYDISIRNDESFASNLNDIEWLSKIISKNNRLLKLYVSNTHHLMHFNNFHYFLQNSFFLSKLMYPELKEVCFDSCKKFNDECLKILLHAITKKCPSVSHLSLYRTMISDLSCDRIIKFLNANAEHPLWNLDLEFCVKITDAGVENWADFLRRHPLRNFFMKITGRSMFHDSIFEEPRLLLSIYP